MRKITKKIIIKVQEWKSENILPIYIVLNSKFTPRLHSVSAGRFASGGNLLPISYEFQLSLQARKILERRAGISLTGRSFARQFYHWHKVITIRIRFDTCPTESFMQGLHPLMEVNSVRRSDLRPCPAMLLIARSDREHWIPVWRSPSDRLLWS